MVRRSVDGLVTRPELAAVFGVHPVTVTEWERLGMPVAVGQEGRRRRRTSFADDFALVGESPAGGSLPGSPFGDDDVWTRRDVAEALGRHPDSVTRALRDGLGCAILDPGGH